MHSVTALTEIYSCPHGQAKYVLTKCFMVREKFCYLATTTRDTFGGVKGKLSNPRTLYQLPSMVVIASRSRAVLLQFLYHLMSTAGRLKLGHNLLSQQDKYPKCKSKLILELIKQANINLPTALNRIKNCGLHFKEGPVPRN